jgi:alpha-tubulin suppressor-like RCC1 family protein
MTTQRETSSLPHAIGAVSRNGMLATLCVLLGACAGSEQRPSVPWLLGATILSAAGLPPARPDFYAAPVRVGDTLKFTAITAGADHTCAIDVGGDTYCWGSNQYQQLGTAVVTETCSDGRLACSSMPVRLEGAPRFTALAASIWSTCGLDVSGRAHCWGFGLGGRLGGSLPASSGLPVEVPGDHEFVALTSSPAGSRTCGLTLAGHAWCWSLSADGALGPSQIFAGPDRIAASASFGSISFGAQHGCATDEALDVYCWGSNQFGQLGAGSSALDGGIRESLVPVAIHGGLKLAGIVAGPGHSCGLHTEGSVYCWGLGFALPGADSSAFLRVPDGPSIPHGSLPVLLETTGTRWATLGAGTTQTCALSVDGELYCFVTTPTRYAVDRRPIRVESDETFIAFAVGGNHACAIGADGFAYCWGSSHAGQVGRPPSGS